MTPTDLHHRSGLHGTAELNNNEERRSTKHASATSASRPRNVSSGELMAGLGIGLDLEDVLDWA